MLGSSRLTAYHIFAISMFNFLILQLLSSVWLEIRLKNKTVLLGTFYRAPNSSIDVHNKIERSIYLAFDTNIPNIIITGDFNYNYSNISSRRKATSLFDQYGLVQLIDEPTHFTETSDSIIDLLLLETFLLLFLVVSVMLFSIKMLDTIVLYMPFLILISVNNIVLKELFGSTMMGTTIF